MTQGRLARRNTDTDRAKIQFAAHREWAADTSVPPIPRHRLRHDEAG